LAKVPLAHYGAQVLLPAAASAGLPALLLAALTHWAKPESWLQLALATGLYSIVFLLACVPLLGAERVWRLCAGVLRSIPGTSRKEIPSPLEGADTST
jgi:hypothetical protein